MTDVLPRLDGAFDGSDKRALDRRQLIKAGAWAAPVLLLATATPAAAAQSAPTPLTPSQPAAPGAGTVPLSKLGVNAGSISNTTGTLQWNGGAIAFSGASYGDPAGTVVYTVVVTGPGGLAKTLESGAATVAPWGEVSWWTSHAFVNSPFASGEYTVTVTAYGASGSVVQSTTSMKV